MTKEMNAKEKDYLGLLSGVRLGEEIKADITYHQSLLRLGYAEEATPCEKRCVLSFGNTQKRGKLMW